MDRKETELDIICFGCAIPGAGARPLGGLSITVPKYRLTKAAAERYAKEIMACAGRISARVAAALPQD